MIILLFTIILPFICLLSAINKKKTAKKYPSRIRNTNGTYARQVKITHIGQTIDYMYILT